MGLCVSGFSYSAEKTRCSRSLPPSSMTTVMVSDWNGSHLPGYVPLLCR